MNSIALRNRQDISVLVILSMVLSMWIAIPAPAKAGVLGKIGSTVGKVAKAVVVNGGALAAGYMGGVLGIAIGAGPVGMVIGAVGGFILAKKVLKWATSSFANVATVLGAVAGGVLLAGTGLPLLAAGILGGALIGRLAAKLIGKITGKSVLSVSIPSGTAKTSAADDKKCNDFINTLNQNSGGGTAAPAPVAAEVKAAPSAPSGNMQDAYNNYLSSYRAYMEATQKGDSALAKKAFADYQKNLAIYQGSMGSGS